MLGVYGMMLCGAITTADNRDVQGNKKREQRWNKPVTFMIPGIE